MYPGSCPLPETGTGSQRLGPLFLESFPLMVRPGLAWSHVQPVLENISESSQLSAFSSQWF
jgi:hypothetical protein